MGRRGERSALGCENHLHRTHRTDVLTPGFTAVEPTEESSRRCGDQKQRKQGRRAAVHPQQAQTEATNQETPLQLQMVLRQP